MTSKWKAITNIHQSLKRFPDIYGVLPVGVSRLRCGFMSLRVRNTCDTESGVSQSPRQKRKAEEKGALTLDVDGDAGLLAIGDGLVGGLADDLLARLDVGRRQVERAHRALPPAVAEQRLRKKRQKQKVEQMLKSYRGGRCGDEII